MNQAEHERLQQYIKILEQISPPVPLDPELVALLLDPPDRETVIAGALTILIELADT